MSRVGPTGAATAAVLLLLVGPSKAASARNTRKIGDSVSLGGERFVIWGSATTGVMPKGLSVSPDGRRLYVANFGRLNRNVISVFNAFTLKALPPLNLPGNAIETALSPNGRWLYSTDKTNRCLRVMDTRTLTVARNVRVRGYPKVILVSRDGRWIYLSRWGDGRITRLRSDTFEQQTLYIRQKNPRGLAFSRDGKKLYVANNGSKAITVVDTVRFKVIKHIKTRRGPRHVAAEHKGNRIYVSVLGTSNVLVLDSETDRIIRRIPVGKHPKTLEVSKDDRFVYTANYSGHSMSIIDTRTYQTAELLLDIWKGSGLVVHPSDLWIYVTGWCSYDVWTVQRVGPRQKEAPPGPLRKRRFICRKCPVADFMGCDIKRQGEIKK